MRRSFLFRVERRSVTTSSFSLCQKFCWLVLNLNPLNWGRMISSNARTRFSNETEVFFLLHCQDWAPLFRLNKQGELIASNQLCEECVLRKSSTGNITNIWTKNDGKFKWFWHSFWDFLWLFELRPPLNLSSLKCWIVFEIKGCLRFHSNSKKDLYLFRMIRAFRLQACVHQVEQINVSRFILSCAWCATLRRANFEGSTGVFSRSFLRVLFWIFAIAFSDRNYMW